MDDDGFPDIPLDNFGADTNVATQPVEEPKTAPETDATGSEESQAAQPVETEDNPKAESEPSEQVSADEPVETEQSDQTGRPEKQDRVQMRFDKLTREKYEQAETIQQLERQVAQFKAQQGIQPLQPDENGYLDPQALQNYINQTAQAQSQAQIELMNARLEREQISQRIENEGSEIEKKYAEYLDADPVHAENIRALVEDKVNDNIYNTDALKTVSPMQIAERYFKGIEAERKRAQIQTQQNLADLQADSAVTSDTTKPSVDPDSIEALEEKLANATF